MNKASNDDNACHSRFVGAADAQSLAVNQRTNMEGKSDPNLKELLNTWYTRAHVVINGHYTTASVFDRKHYWLGIPSITLSAAVGTAIFATLQNSPEVYIQIIVGLSSMAAAVLAVLQTFLRYSERAERHRKAGVRYAGIMRELEQALVLPPVSEDGLHEFINRIRRRWDKLGEESPIIPPRIWSKVDGHS